MPREYYAAFKILLKLNSLLGLFRKNFNLACARIPLVGQLVETTVRQIESAQFLPHSGIRFPQNPCSSCPYIGLRLGRQELVEAALIRRPGAESLDWLDELHY